MRIEFVQIQNPKSKIQNPKDWLGYRSATITKETELHNQTLAGRSRFHRRIAYFTLALIAATFACASNPAQAQWTPYSTQVFNQECDLFLQERVATQPPTTTVSSILVSPKGMTSAQLDQLKALGLDVYET